MRRVMVILLQEKNLGPNVLYYVFFICYCLISAFFLIWLWAPLHCSHKTKLIISKFKFGFGHISEVPKNEINNLALFYITPPRPPETPQQIQR